MNKFDKLNSITRRLKLTGFVSRNAHKTLSWFSAAGSIPQNSPLLK